MRAAIRHSLKVAQTSNSVYVPSPAKFQEAPRRGLDLPGHRVLAPRDAAVRGRP